MSSKHYTAPFKPTHLINFEDARVAQAHKEWIERGQSPNPRPVLITHNFLTHPQSIQDNRKRGESPLKYAPVNVEQQKMREQYQQSLAEQKRQLQLQKQQEEMRQHYLAEQQRQMEAYERELAAHRAQLARQQIYEKALQSQNGAISGQSTPPQQYQWPQYPHPNEQQAQPQYPNQQHVQQYPPSQQTYSPSLQQPQQQMPQYPVQQQPPPQQQAPLSTFQHLPSYSSPQQQPRQHQSQPSYHTQSYSQQQSPQQQQQPQRHQQLQRQMNGSPSSLDLRRAPTAVHHLQPLPNSPQPPQQVRTMNHSVSAPALPAGIARGPTSSVADTFKPFDADHPPPTQSNRLLSPAATKALSSSGFKSAIYGDEQKSNQQTTTQSAQSAEETNENQEQSQPEPSSNGAAPVPNTNLSNQNATNNQQSMNELGSAAAEYQQRFQSHPSQSNQPYQQYQHSPQQQQQQQHQSPQQQLSPLRHPLTAAQVQAAAAAAAQRQAVSKLEQQRLQTAALQRQAHLLPVAGSTSSKLNKDIKGDINTTDAIFHYQNQEADEAFYSSLSHSVFDVKDPTYTGPRETVDYQFHSETENKSRYQNPATQATIPLSSDFQQRKAIAFNAKHRLGVHQTPLAPGAINQTHSTLAPANVLGQRFDSHTSTKLPSLNSPQRF